MADLWEVTATVLDGQGKTSPMSFYLDGVAHDTIASATTAAQTIIEAASAMMLGAVQEVRIARIPDTSTWTLARATPDAQANRAYKGRMIWLDGAGFKTRISLPAFNIAHVVPNSENVDTGVATPGATLLAAIQGVTPTSAHGDELLSIVKFYEVHGQ